MKRKLFVIVTVLSVFLCLCGAVLADEGSKILAQVDKSTVRIISDRGSGSGFFINEKHIVTNHHVVSPYLTDSLIGGEGWDESATNTTVEVVYSLLGNDYVNGVVILDWPEVDLAIIEVDPNIVKRIPIKLQTQENIVRGMQIYTIGFPAINYESFIEGNSASSTQGSISNITKSSITVPNGVLYDQLVISSAVNPGNSGGPIVDSKGNVVGIANAGLISSDNIAFFGIHVNELITRLNKEGISYHLANNNMSLILWILIGVLGAAVIAAAILLVMKGRKGNVKPVNTSDNASIQGVSGQFSGIKKQLSKERDCIIGTNPSVCNLVFEKSERNVSGKHCRIHYSNTNQCYVIQDLGSTNGTVLVRGSQQRQVPSNAGLALHDGDLIYVPTKNNTFRINL